MKLNWKFKVVKNAPRYIGKSEREYEAEFLTADTIVENFTKLLYAFKNDRDTGTYDFYISVAGDENYYSKVNVELSHPVTLKDHYDLVRETLGITDAATIQA